MACLDKIIENQKQLLHQIGRQQLDGDDIVEDVLEHPIETVEEHFLKEIRRSYFEEKIGNHKFIPLILIQCRSCVLIIIVRSLLTVEYGLMLIPDF